MYVCAHRHTHHHLKQIFLHRYGALTWSILFHFLNAGCRPLHEFKTHSGTQRSEMEIHWLRERAKGCSQMRDEAPRLGCRHPCASSSLRPQFPQSSSFALETYRGEGKMNSLILQVPARVHRLTWLFSGLSIRGLNWRSWTLAKVTHQPRSTSGEGAGGKGREGERKRNSRERITKLASVTTPSPPRGTPGLGLFP